MFGHRANGHKPLPLPSGRRTVFGWSCSSAEPVRLLQASLHLAALNGPPRESLRSPVYARHRGVCIQSPSNNLVKHVPRFYKLPEVTLVVRTGCFNVAWVSYLQNGRRLSPPTSGGISVNQFKRNRPNVVGVRPPEFKEQKGTRKGRRGCVRSRGQRFPTRFTDSTIVFACTMCREND